MKLIELDIIIKEENGLKIVYVSNDMVEMFTRELFFNMLVQNPKYVVEFLGYTIYSIPKKKTDKLKLGIIMQYMPSTLQNELNKRKEMFTEDELMNLIY